MKYVPGHQRISRGGESVHTTQEEKTITIKQDDEIRQEIEAKFLAPKSKNFVETEAVRAYEKRIELWLKAGYPVHIIGPTGCGKTALAIKVAEKLKKPAIWINGDEAITTHDLIGGYSKIETSTVRDKYIHNVYKDKDIIEPLWVSNPLTLAVQHGYTLIYNEFSRTKPEANNILLSILEEGVLELPTKFGEERYVKVHPNFSMILTSNNVEYAGVHKPQDALLDRMPAIHMNYYDEDTEVKIIRAHAEEISEDVAKKIVAVVRGLRNKLNDAEKPGTRPAIMIAQSLQSSENGFSKEFFEQVATDAIASKFKDLKDTQDKMALIKNQIQKVLS
ncbi:MAG: gas vesicle protein GvpN [Nanoarchaeota archaeon]|nr:gas vesicle protein GvpN [Nanoarchaeota archaeon]